MSAHVRACVCACVRVCSTVLLKVEFYCVVKSGVLLCSLKWSSTALFNELFCCTALSFTGN